MKTFTATPEEFATGRAITKATHLFINRNRKPPGKRAPRQPDPKRERQIGTVSPEDFAAGRPYVGKRVRGHRVDAVPTLKPLPEALVDTLLETDEIGDPKDYALVTNAPTKLMQGSLRDELVERGWRHIKLSPGDDGEWELHATYIDEAHRAYWMSVGARVAPAPEETPDLHMKLMRMFKAAARRAGMQIEEARLESLRSAHDGFDLEADYGDFENDPGDWDVTIQFFWRPAEKFWSRASQALGYEDKPYQKSL